MERQHQRDHDAGLPEQFPRRVLLQGMGSLLAGAVLSACGGGGGGSGGSGTGANATGAGASADTSTSSRSGATSAADAGVTATPAATTAATTTQTPAASVPVAAEPAATTASATTATSAATSAFRLGVYSGGFDPGAAEAYQKWLGKTPAYNVDFLTDTNTPWDLGMWTPLLKVDPGHDMLFSIPLDNLTQDAAGSHDAMFRSMALAIAAIYPAAMIRIGWEMNGDWYAWSAAGREALYITAFNRVAALFKAVSPSFLIDWCPNNGAVSNMDCALAYPGDQYVDCIGMDTYMDYRYGSADSTDRWNYLVGNGRGLQWQVTFAAEHRKLLSLPEWGVNADDPLFIKNVHSWVSAHGYHHASYWDSNAAFQSQLSKGQYPKAAATFKSLFGA